VRSAIEHSGRTWRCGDGVERKSTVMEHGGGESVLMKHGGGDGDTISDSGRGAVSWRFPGGFQGTTWFPFFVFSSFASHRFLPSLAVADRLRGGEGQPGSSEASAVQDAARSKRISSSSQPPHATDLNREGALTTATSTREKRLTTTATRHTTGLGDSPKPIL